MTDLPRYKTLLCFLFGHEWNENGFTQDTATGIKTDIYRRCARCQLEQHDRSGAIALYEAKYGKLTKAATGI